MNKMIKHLYIIEFGDTWKTFRGKEKGMKAFLKYGKYCIPANIETYNFIDKYKIFGVKDE